MKILQFIYLLRKHLYLLLFIWIFQTATENDTQMTDLAKSLQWNLIRNQIASKCSSLQELFNVLLECMDKQKRGGWKNCGI